MDMTSKERMYAAYRGDPVDRVPIWLREGFALSHSPAEADHFNAGWQADPLYHELINYVKPHADDIVGWSIPGNRLLMIPGRYIRSQTIEDAPPHRIDEITIDTPSGDLKSIVRRPRHESHSWTLKYPVETVDDLRKLASVPWELAPRDVERARENYRQAHAAHGDRVMLRTFLSSPVVCISGSMPLELFLELSLTERAWFHELTDEITRRQLAILEAVFDGQEIETTVTFGGSEQCTPPMMAPGAFDEYVVPYEGRLIEFLKQRGILCSVHCHGKVRHALKCMVEMGADATDPVEPPPAGDVTFAEAREIVGDRLTLKGNLEWDILETAEPAEVKRQVGEILRHGDRRVILGASAGPISAVSRRLVDNYKAWIDAAVEFDPNRG